MKAIALILALALAGCATTKGLEVSADDAAECAAAGCTPWSERQNQGLAKHFYGLGHKAGLKQGKGSI